MSELIQLSWQTQVVLVGGYLSYVIAYAGRRSTHRTLDTLLIILCFGGIGLLVIAFLETKIPPENSYKNIQSAVFAVLACILSALIWRGFLRELSLFVVNKLSRSEEDGLSTAWETITQTQSLSYSQINILMKDGRTLESYLLGDFNDLPNGPCILGGDGSIALYVTHITDKEGERRDTRNVIDDDGARITYVPASEIVEVDFRRKRKTNP